MEATDSLGKTTWAVLVDFAVHGEGADDLAVVDERHADEGERLVHAAAARAVQEAVVLAHVQHHLRPPIYWFIYGFRGNYIFYRSYVKGKQTII